MKDPDDIKCRECDKVTLGGLCGDCADKRDKLPTDEEFAADADREMYGDENPYDLLTGWK